jgi:phage-related protein
MKPVIWLGSSKRDVGRFPDEARQEAGFELFQVQLGLEPSDWKEMPSVGSGVREIRIHDRNEFRVLYVAKFSDAIYVLHAFAKKTQKTSVSDLELAGRRFRELVGGRRR